MEPVSAKGLRETQSIKSHRQWEEERVPCVLERGCWRGFQLELQRRDPAIAHLIRQTTEGRKSLGAKHSNCPSDLSCQSQDMHST